MSDRPAIRTARLKLRALHVNDVPDIARLAGVREIADTMISVPHPITVEDAEGWIAHQAGEPEARATVPFGIELRRTGELIGMVELRDIDRKHMQAELSFWIGVDWWNQGYAAEAARSALDYGFNQLRLNRIYAHHMIRNPASGRVLLKIGMKQEGLMRERVRKWDLFENVILYAILRCDSRG